MKKSLFSVLIILAVAFLAFHAFTAEHVVFTPAESDALFANPGMGWQTFHNFADTDQNLDGLPSASAYYRLYWDKLEPADGNIDFALVDSLLMRAHKAHQKLALRVMCIGTEKRPLYVPSWLKENGCPGFEFTREGDDVQRWVPDMDSPMFLEKHLRLIRELGKRYDGHPDLDALDLGTVGLWGEWHMSGTGVEMPSEATQRRILDTYYEAFPRTPKVMLIGGGESLRYAIEKGAGWRADCLGDMGGFSKTWNHMDNFYPQAVEKASAADTWKTAPVAFETCWTMKKWKDEGWCIPCIFNYSLDYHASYVNNKSSKIPDGTRPEIEKLLLKLGYRLVLRSADCETGVRAGSPMSVSMKWENVGVAPPYTDYYLALQLTNAQGATQATLPTDVSIKGWLPGTRDISIMPVIPKNVEKGTYNLSIAVVDSASKKPAVNLAIVGRSSDGWYTLGKIDVK